VALMAWGVLATMTGIIRHLWLLAVDRLLLGVAESFILPAMPMLLMQWFTRTERPRANSFLILWQPCHYALDVGCIRLPYPARWVAKGIHPRRAPFDGVEHRLAMSAVRISQA